VGRLRWRLPDCGARGASWELRAGHVSELVRGTRLTGLESILGIWANVCPDGFPSQIARNGGIRPALPARHSTRWDPRVPSRAPAMGGRLRPSAWASVRSPERWDRFLEFGAYPHEAQQTSWASWPKGGKSKWARWMPKRETWRRGNFQSIVSHRPLSLPKHSRKWPAVIPSPLVPVIPPIVNPTLRHGDFAGPVLQRF